MERAGVGALARALLEAGALKFGRFTLTSGRQSAYYIDLRVLPSYPSYFRLALRAYASVLSRLLPFHALCSIPTSGLIFASALAYRLRLPLAYVRKEERAHGLRRALEGRLERGWSVVLLDDVATTGGSLLAAARAVRAAGAEVRAAVVLVDRLEGARRALGEEGVELHAYCDVLSLARALASEGRLGPSELSAIEGQLGG
ncbi:MAG: orotate phosphoribosyltransferase [Nitrososphaerota archaeon]